MSIKLKHPLCAYDLETDLPSITYLRENGEQVFEPFEEVRHKEMFGEPEVKKMKRIFANLADPSCLPSGLGEDKVKRELFNEIRTAYQAEFAFGDERLEDYISQYTFNTYVHDLHSHVNVTMIVAPSNRGKTALQEALYNKLYMPYFGSGADTSACLRRSVDAGFVPIIDESQSSLSDTKSDDHALLTMGTSKGGRINCLMPTKNGTDFVRQSFHAFGPKIFGARYIPDDDAILNRSTIIRLKKLPSNSYDSLSDPLSVEAKQRGQKIRNDMTLYRLRRLNGLNDVLTESEILGRGFHLEGRTRKLMFPLLCEAPSDRVRENIHGLILEQLGLAKKDRENSIESTILLSGYKLLIHPEASPTCKSIALMAQDWIGSKIAAKTVGKVLKQYDIPTKRTQCGFQISCSRDFYEQKLVEIDLEIPKFEIHSFKGGFND